MRIQKRENRHSPRQKREDTRTRTYPAVRTHKRKTRVLKIIHRRVSEEIRSLRMLYAEILFSNSVTETVNYFYSFCYSFVP